MTTSLASKHWTRGKLQDLVFFQRGFDITKAQQTDGPVPVISSSGVTSYHNEARATGPGVVIGRKGTLGSVHYSEVDYWPHDTTLWSKDLRGNNPRFVYFYLHTINFKRFDVGNSNPTLNRNHIHDLPALIPPSDTQTRIADTLSAYDDLIDNNRRRMALLEDAARQLYREWFVRLRFPGHEHTRITNGVPDGWRADFLGSVAENLDRLRVPLSVFEREARPGPHPHHGAAGVLDHIDGFIFDGRYLLVGEDGTVQTTAGKPMLQLVEGKFWVSNHAHVLQGRTLSTGHLYCLLAEYPIAGHVTGVAQPKLTQGNLNRIPVLVPSAMYRDQFQQTVEPMFMQRFVLGAQNEKLRAARDLLLPRLMCGEIAV